MYIDVIRCKFRGCLPRMLFRGCHDVFQPRANPLAPDRQPTLSAPTTHWMKSHPFLGIRSYAGYEYRYFAHCALLPIRNNQGRAWKNSTHISLHLSTILYKVGVVPEQGTLGLPHRNYSSMMQSMGGMGAWEHAIRVIIPQYAHY